jgi:hypothetical protein
VQHGPGIGATPFEQQLRVHAQVRVRPDRKGVGCGQSEPTQGWRKDFRGPGQGRRRGLVGFGLALIFRQPEMQLLKGLFPVHSADLHGPAGSLSGGAAGQVPGFEHQGV